MELVSGANLRRILSERRLSVEETLKVATGVASALAEAHRHGLIHRDIKPGNIQITSAGEVKVLDFGIARTATPRDARHATAATVTLEGFSGTPLYMSPEQASGGMRARTCSHSAWCSMSAWPVRRRSKLRASHRL